ncbi:hypothetical protein L227DRAFT_62353 [Lentinus tigrinus ALCF2SS1-6]|uniref:Uncharacterized protein n=1 Tax=Lentinus tigrinus ALCF2SS1-6 TaxID=1328759 RepID=A0A5C2RKZ6_9APHY|nr:hypothetical protein L227DRAFT_62353 [Lentinus tigrinus ALCF2SS1-6]
MHRRCWVASCLRHEAGACCRASTACSASVVDLPPCSVPSTTTTTTTTTVTQCLNPLALFRSRMLPLFFCSSPTLALSLLAGVATKIDLASPSSSLVPSKAWGWITAEVLKRGVVAHTVKITSRDCASSRCNWSLRL